MRLKRVPPRPRGLSFMPPSIFLSTASVHRPKVLEGLERLPVTAAILGPRGTVSSFSFLSSSFSSFTSSSSSSFPRNTHNVPHNNLADQQQIVPRRTTIPGIIFLGEEITGKHNKESQGSRETCKRRPHEAHSTSP
ncbi:hypothetical protein E2C01_076904 [Portunus trituberculatus]|uniref:Uncharacterized protein n=1 Tax=Portunus trituberculatus TaxID=210409 RepID=A0A5B7I9Z8_PORTR|nr:hypothetical protein [Portunus trituberculatus]